MTAAEMQRSIARDLFRLVAVMLAASATVGYTVGIVSRPHPPTSIRNGIQYHSALKKKR